MWKGAFSLQERYTHWDIEEVVSYAKERGVHVVPEFDMPATPTPGAREVGVTCATEA